MLFTEYNISIPTANNTIDRMHRILADRNIPLKRGDVKEVIAQLLSFDTSKALDEKIKKEQEHGSLPYDLNGVHKDYPNVWFQRFRTALEADDYFKVTDGFNCICCFDVDHESGSGFEYQVGDFVLAENPMDAAKALINWDEDTSLEYVFHDDKERADKPYDGYWHFTASGDGLLELLNQDCIEFDVCNKDFNTPDCDRRKLEEYIFNELAETALPFSCFTTDQCVDYVMEWMFEEYERAHEKVRNLKMYKQLVKRFMGNIPIEAMAWIEAYSGSADHLAVLNELGARLDDPQLMLNAAVSSCHETLDYLLYEGNSLDVFYRVDMSDSETYAMNDQIALYVHTREDLDLGVYLKTLRDLGVDINYADANGNTPLHFVAFMADTEVYKYCVDLGADELAINRCDFSPSEVLQMCIQDKHTQALLDADADEIRH